MTKLIIQKLQQILNNPEKLTEEQRRKISNKIVNLKIKPKKSEINEQNLTVLDYIKKINTTK